MSNADKRSVHTDALETLGTIIGADQARDAIHLAVEPAVAGETLQPGEHVGFAANGKVYGSYANFKGDSFTPKALGIVDPFLTAPVEEGQCFWFVVYPRQITSLRHVWAHPDFPESELTPAPSTDKAVSEAWLRDFVSKADCPDYGTVMAKAGDFCNGDTDWSDEYLHFDGRDAHGEIPAEFWAHFEVVTGLRPQGKAPEYFSCAC